MVKKYKITLNAAEGRAAGTEIWTLLSNCLVHSGCRLAAFSDFRSNGVKASLKFSLKGDEAELALADAFIDGAAR